MSGIGNVGESGRKSGGQGPAPSLLEPLGRLDEGAVGQETLNHTMEPLEYIVSMSGEIWSPATQYEHIPGHAQNLPAN